MKQVIVFYIPANFKTPQPKWIPESQRGKVITFHSEVKKSA